MRSVKQKIANINKEIKLLGQRLDMAYEMAINDKGRSMERLQQEIDVLIDECSELIRSSL